MNSMFYLYVPDVDSAYRRAVAAGATSSQEPADQPYGDRTASVKDIFGHQWYIATHIKDMAHSCDASFSLSRRFRCQSRKQPPILSYTFE